MKDFRQFLSWLFFCGDGDGLVVGGGAFVHGGGSVYCYLGGVCICDVFMKSQADLTL